jgi:PII-like signaling protein
MQGERVLMRIHITEGDRYAGDALSERILALIRERHYAGATIFRGAMSFGTRSRTHSDRVEVLALDLPVVIECVETEENILKILPEIDGMIGGGLITLEKVNVVAYRDGDAGEQSTTQPSPNE